MMPDDAPKSEPKSKSLAQAKRRQEALASRKYSCRGCDYYCGDKYSLRKHEKSCCQGLKTSQLVATGASAVTINPQVTRLVGVMSNSWYICEHCGYDSAFTPSQLDMIFNDPPQTNSSAAPKGQAAG
jgi:hypothetical protein